MNTKGMATIYIPVFLLFLFLPDPTHGQGMITPFEKDENTTARYNEIIQFYHRLDKEYPSLKFIEIGKTDSGKPLHACILDKQQDFKPDNRLVLFINNGIHPGEPCGIDASMMWIRDLLEMGQLHQDIVIVLIPVYNVGGALNRNSTTRVNQLGPDAHGFRGNAKNLDLNRDFIKCDSKNAAAFNQFYANWKPHIFVDTHTSNGADYQHTMTLINTQPDRLPSPMKGFLREVMLPMLYKKMESRNWIMSPYVYTRGTPDEGLYGFLDLPRYSSGYAALHHAYSFIPETHMLKPFKDRVHSTYDLLGVFLEFANNHQKEILQTITEAKSWEYKLKKYPLHWTIDQSLYSTITFRGYEAGRKASKVSGLNRLYYDKDNPYEKEIPWYEYYKPTHEVDIPRAYLIPAAYYEITDRFQWNKILMDTIKKEQNLKGEIYHIQSYETVDAPYEGHYLHSNIKVSKESSMITAKPGDLIVPVDQPGWRYIIETLEPENPDSYFAWNFMDAILQRKEHFSSYVFEDTAAELLAKNPKLRKQLDQAIEKDPSMKKNARAQLYFIYKNSKFSENAYMKYPIYRITQ